MKSDSLTPPALPWCDSFSVGVAALDADHRGLVDRINEICSHARVPRRDEALQAFDLLCSQAAAHFEREEKVLQALSGYSHLQAHAGEHRNRLRQLENLRQRYRATTEAAAVAGLCEDLIHWFVRQSIGHDAEIKSFCDGREPRFPLPRGGRVQP